MAKRELSEEDRAVKMTPEEAVRYLWEKSDRGVYGITGHDWGERSAHETAAKIVLNALKARKGRVAEPPTRTEEPSKLSDYHFELLEGGDDRGEVGLRDVAMKAARRLAFLEAEREKQTVQILGHEQSYKMLRTQLDEHVTDVSRLREQIETMRELLRELYAMVQGECPSLLREDSGGNGELSLRIDAALFPPERQ